MESVFIYWDNSNIFHEAQRFAEERSEGPDARFRVRIHFDNILRLTHADRPVERAFAAGSIPPELRQLWNRMEAIGVEAQLFDRGSPERGEQDQPDRVLQLRMLEDALNYNGDPGITVLLTGDGAGYLEGAGFHRTLERMQKRGWRVKLPLVEGLLQPENAALGGGARRVHPAGRLLRLHHLPHAVQSRFRACATAHRGAPGHVAARHRMMVSSAYRCRGYTN